MLSVIQWVTTAAVSTPTATGAVQLLLALTLPAATLALLGKSKVTSVTWFDVLGVIGVLLVPTTVILALRGVIGPQVTAGIVGVLFGHVVTFIDTD